MALSKEQIITEVAAIEAALNAVQRELEKQSRFFPTTAYALDTISEATVKPAIERIGRLKADIQR